MDTLILIVHFTACFLLIIAVLLQSGKNSSMGMFGGSGSDAIFSASSSMDFIKKFTIGAAITVALTSVSLTFFTARLSMSSVVNKYRMTPPQSAQPAQPAPAKAR